MEGTLTVDEAMLDPSYICCGHAPARESNLADAFLKSRRIVDEIVKIVFGGLSDADLEWWISHRIVISLLQLLIAVQLFV